MDFAMSIPGAVPPTLELRRALTVVARVTLDGPIVSEVHRPSIGELQECGLQLLLPEIDLEYCVCVGDFRLVGSGARSGGPDFSIGRRFGSAVLWEDGLYFESARGETRITVLSRSRPAAGPWRVRGAMNVDVVPTKLGEQRYQTMFESLRYLAQGLVYDLLAKSTRTLGMGLMPEGGLSTRSSQLELHALERVCSEVELALRTINREPARRLQRVQRKRLFWGSERASTRSLVGLVQRGADPRGPSATWPIPLLCDDLEESMDTIEHRSIAGFLRFLLSRIEDCRNDAGLHIAAIEADRRFLDVKVCDEPTLYKSLYVPRIERLMQAQVRSTALEARVVRALRSRCLLGRRPEYSLRTTPVFENVVPYRRLWATMCRYFEAAMIFLDEGVQERVKATSRMYEQWVFFQLAAAFRVAGLRCEGASGFLHRRSRRCFTLDLDRNTQLIFRCGDGRAVSLRYEPWISGKSDAIARRDTVYRGRVGEAAWSPDILLEVISPVAVEGEAPSVEFAAVIDAKYSTRIREHHWVSVDKYLEIRGTTTEGQVVRQVWLAYPDRDESISLCDPTLSWTSRGPDVGLDEQIRGTIGMLPAAELEAPGNTGRMRACDTAVEFARGLLEYLEMV